MSDDNSTMQQHSQSMVATPDNYSPDFQSVTANVKVKEPEVIKVTVESEKNVNTLPNECVSVIYIYVATSLCIIAIMI